MATTRKELFRKFGPHQFEALVVLLFKQINILRQRAGLAPVTVQDALDALDTEQKASSPIDWSKE